MFLRTKDSLINLDTAKMLQVCECGRFIDATMTIKFTDGNFYEIKCDSLATVERKLDAIQEALQAGVPVFDMR